MIHSVISEIFSSITQRELLIIVAVLVLAGTVKGSLGFGLPLVGVPLLASVISLRLAAALMVFPIIASNVWVGLEGGQFWRILKRFWMVALSMGVGIFVGSRILVEVNEHVVLGLLGIVVVIFVGVDQFASRLRIGIPDHWAGTYGVIAGAVGGVIGGMSTMLGPPVLLYLTALRLPRDLFVRANCVLAVSGAIFLSVAFSSSRVLTRHTAVMSTLCMVPVLVGLILGRTIRRRLRPDAFGRLVAIALLLIGLNLIRRSLMP